MLRRLASRHAVLEALAAKGLTPFPVCPACLHQVPAATFSDLGACTACTAILNDLEAEALARHRATQRHQELADLTKSLLTAPLEVLAAAVVQGAGPTEAELDALAMADANHQAERDARYGDLGLPSDALVHPEDAMVWDEED